MSYKQSDRRVLSAEGKIVAALLRKQPQKIGALCKSAGIHETSFYRLRRLLLDKEIIKETERGFALSDYIDPTSAWNNLKLKFKQIGVTPAKIVMRKACDIGSDAVSGERQSRYDEARSVEGIVVTANAPMLVDVARASGIIIENCFLGVILTADFVERWDRFLWNKWFLEVRDIQERFDNDYSVGYRIGLFDSLREAPPV